VSDPLTPEERDEHEADLIAFSDRELDLLGDIRGRNVLYAGGTSPLWIEGLAERIGKCGSLTVLDLDEEGVSEARNFFDAGELPTEPRFVVGDVFDPPFEGGSFDLVYSSGLFHELDVSERDVGEALSALANTLRSGERLATSDFVDDVEAAQTEEEAIEAEAASRESGARRYGIGGSERLVELHEKSLFDVRWRVLPPRPIRHLELLLSESGPTGLSPRLLARRERLLDRVRREGYTRPATVYVEGFRRACRA
jgi:SAM-dependent methyltransferase